MTIAINPNLAICYDDRASRNGTYSGGSWRASLPLNNLKTFDPKQVARSTNDSAANTVFVLDHGSAVDIDLVALINHNLTAAGTARVRVGPSASGASALIDQTLTAGDFGTDEPASLFYINAETVTARYVRWDITDESNPAGYVQIGRHIVGPVFQPAVNVGDGAQIEWIDDSRLSRANDGTQYADLKPKRRRLSGSFDMLSSAESFDEIFDMQRICGVTVPMFAVYDPSLTGSALQRVSIYGTMAGLLPLQLSKMASEDQISDWRFVLEERT